ncbi:MAG TPA: hypothetical protein VL307_15170 [Chitinophagaceae bacterium]|nr:hypothetical protein [Chitinophagaceae bacterium]
MTPHRFVRPAYAAGLLLLFCLLLLLYCRGIHGLALPAQHNSEWLMDADRLILYRHGGQAMLPCSYILTQPLLY